MKKLEVLIAAMVAALAANPQDEKALIQKELSEAYEESISAKNLEVAKQHDELVSKLKASEDRIAELELELDEANNKLTKATDQLASEKPAFELGGKKYEVIARRANVPGFGVVTATDIIGDAELQQALVSKGSGVIREKA